MLKVQRIKLAWPTSFLYVLFLAEIIKRAFLHGSVVVCFCLYLPVSNVSVYLQKRGKENNKPKVLLKIASLSAHDKYKKWPKHKIANSLVQLQKAQQC